MSLVIQNGVQFWSCRWLEESPTFRQIQKGGGSDMGLLSRALGRQIPGGGGGVSPHDWLRTRFQKRRQKGVFFRHRRCGRFP